MPAVPSHAAHAGPARRGRRAHRAPAGEGERLRTELMDAAEALLADKGSADAVTLRAVAKAVGVTATSVYLHFADKDDLLIAVCTRRFETLAQELRDARAAHDTPAGKVRACGRAYVRFGLNRPAAYTVLFGTLPMSLILERLPEDQLVGMHALNELAEVVAEGMADGSFTPGDPLATTIGLWAVVHGLVGALHHGHAWLDTGDDAVIDRTLDMVLQGLVAR